MKTILLKNKHVYRNFYCDPPSGISIWPIESGLLSSGEYRDKFDACLVHHSILNFDINHLGTTCKLFATNTSNLGDTWSYQAQQLGYRVFRTNDIPREKMERIKNVAEYAIAMAMMAWYRIPQRLTRFHRDDVKLPVNQLDGCVTYSIFGNKNGRISQQIARKMDALGALRTEHRSDIVFNCTTPGKDASFLDFLNSLSVYTNPIIVDITGRMEAPLVQFLERDLILTYCMDTKKPAHLHDLTRTVIYDTPRCAGSTAQARAHTERELLLLMFEAWKHRNTTSTKVPDMRENEWRENW